MAIVALLLALIVTATSRFIVGARESATVATINKASGIIQDRVRAFRNSDFTDTAIVASNNWNMQNYSSPFAGGVYTDMTEILVRKLRFKKAFPQAFAELSHAQLTRFFPSYASTPPYYPVVSTTPPISLYDPKYEPGIVLYALLMYGETFGAATPGADTFTGAEVKNTPQTGNLPCLVDAWGEPLRFYRWPTRLIRCGEQPFDGVGTFDDYNQNNHADTSGGTWTPPIVPFPASTIYLNGPTPASLHFSGLQIIDRTSAYAKGPDGAPGVAGVDDDNINGVDDPGEIGWPLTDDPQPLNTDPDDPSFKLSFWFTLYPPTNFVTGTAGALHDYYTYHAPLIVSPGQDRQLGLWEPTDVPTSANPNSVNFGYLAAPMAVPTAKQSLQYMFDNITNLNQRAGGK